MKIGLNIAVYDALKSFKKVLDNLKEINVDSIELPVRLVQKQLEDKKEINHLSNFNVVNFSNLLCKTVIFPQSIFVDSKIFEEQFLSLENKFKLCKSYKCSNTSLVIDPLIDLKYIDARKIFIERVRRIAKVAEVYNININLEYISHFVSMNNGEKRPNLFCSSVGEVLDLIDDIDLSNVKLLLDFLHWYCDEKKPSIDYIKDYIGLVQICDQKEKKLNKIKDTNRILPFEGCLPLKFFINELNKTGYFGYVLIEVFRTNNYKPNNEVIKKSMSKLRNIFEGKI